MKLKKILQLTSVISFLSLTLGKICFAAGKLELDYPSIGGLKLTTETNLPQFIKYIFNLAIGISGLLAFGVLIAAGIQLLLSQGNPGKMNDAKDQIFQAFIGLIILLSAYVILSTINPDLIYIEMPKI